MFCISGVMVSVIASSEVLCGLKSQSGQNKDYEIDICCFSAALKSLGIRIICPSGVTCLSEDYCFSDLNVTL